MRKTFLTTAFTTLITALAYAQEEAAPVALGVNDLPKMHAIYSANSIKFRNNFVGKSFTAVLPFQTMTEDWFDKGVTIFLGDNETLGSDVHCSPSNFSDPRIAKWIATLDKGNSVSVRGIVKDSTLGSILLNDCVISSEGGE